MSFRLHLFKSYILASALLFLSGIWLTGCLESLDPQLTPVITSISPDTTTYGATIAVRGQNFSFLNAATSVVLVIYGDADTMTLDKPTITKTDLGENEIRTFIPNLPAGKYHVYLLVKDRESDRKSNEVPLTILTFGPSSIEPSRGPAGTLVTIRGNGLKKTTKLVFRSGISSLEVAPDSPPTDQEVKVRVPEGATPGVIKMQLEGITIEPETPEFRVTLLPPTVAKLQPAKGPIGTKVEITGTHFGLAAGSDIYFSRKVFFTGPNNTRLEATFLQTVSDPDSADKKFIATVPPGALTGPVIVEIDGVAALQQPVFTVEQPVSAKQLFWYDGGLTSVYQASIGSEKPATVTITKAFEHVDANAYTLNAILSRENKRFYLIKGDNATGAPFIESVNLKGQDKKSVLPSLTGFSVTAFKVAGQHLYWIEDNTMIYRANLDGSGKTTVYQEENGASIANLDVPDTEEYVYWVGTESDFQYAIKRRSASGNGAVQALFSGTDVADGGSIDLTDLEVTSDRLYVTGYDQTFAGTILVGKADGSGTLTVGTPAFGNLSPATFEVDEKAKKLYWWKYEPSTGAFDMFRSDLDGTNQERLFNPADGESYPQGTFDVL